jgi:hypothetical protein
MFLAFVDDYMATLQCQSHDPTLPDKCVLNIAHVAEQSGVLRATFKVCWWCDVIKLRGVR